MRGEGRTIRQARTAAPDLRAVEAKAREKLEAEGWRVVRMRIWPCPAQLWNGMAWAEYQAEVEQCSATLADAKPKQS